MAKHSIMPGRNWIGAVVGCRGRGYTGVHWTGVSVRWIASRLIARRDERWSR
jgi:hypothetical protein